jgi:hypothetical protein
VRLTWTREESALPVVRRKAEEAAAAAAVSNADGARSLEYNRVASGTQPADATVASVIVASAAKISKVTPYCIQQRAAWYLMHQL